MRELQSPNNYRRKKKLESHVAQKRKERAMINWKVRVKNKVFWLTLIPAFLLVIQVVAAPFGYEWDFVVLNQQLAAIVNALFALLAIIGIPVDMTTAGFADSEQAMTYEEPK